MCARVCDWRIVGEVLEDGESDVTGEGESDVTGEIERREGGEGGVAIWSRLDQMMTGLSQSVSSPSEVRDVPRHTGT